jgi:hypothetical protein
VRTLLLLTLSADRTVAVREFQAHERIGTAPFVRLFLPVHREIDKTYRIFSLAISHDSENVYLL